MARSTTRSLAGRTATAARKVIARTTGRASGGTAKEAVAKKAAPKKAAPKKAASATKTAAKKTPAKKTPVKKTPAKKAATKKAAPATQTAAKKTPAKTTPAKTTPATRAPAKKTAATAKTAAKQAPAKQTPAKTAAPARKATAERAPATRAPAQEAALATPRKAPRSVLAVKAGETAWTKAELREVLDQLHEQREHSLQVMAAQSDELTGLMRDAGDGAGQDQADVGSTTFERDHEMTILNSERDKLAQIDRALERIDDGSYGICESCGEPIGKMRLMAFPRATLCMTCKQREERR